MDEDIFELLSEDAAEDNIDREKDFGQGKDDQDKSSSRLVSNPIESVRNPRYIPVSTSFYEQKVPTKEQCLGKRGFFGRTIDNVVDGFSSGGLVKKAVKTIAAAAVIATASLYVANSESAIRSYAVQTSYLQEELDAVRGRADSLSGKVSTLESFIDEAGSRGRFGGAYAALVQENATLRRQQELFFDGYAPSVSSPALALDSLDVALGEYVVEVDKPAQRLRVWQRANYHLVADVPASTGSFVGEKSREGDRKTPGGYFTVEKVHNSSRWVHDDRLAYGPLFFRLNFGSWDGQGRYNPSGHCSIGIHGTDKIDNLGFRDSEGCIRVPNDFLPEALAKEYLQPGRIGYIVPDEKQKLVHNVAGVGEDRIRKVYEKNEGMNLR